MTSTRQTAMWTARKSLDRRWFLQATVVSCLPVVFGSPSNLSVTTASQSSCASRMRAWDSSRLSNAVLDHVAGEFGRVGRSIQSQGHKTASDVRTLAANASLLFSHFEEAGLNSILDQNLRECPEDALRFVPQEEHLRLAQRQMANLGLSVSLEQLRAIFSAPYEKKARALSEIQRLGIQGAANRLVENLNQVATSLEQQNVAMKVGFVRVLQDPWEALCEGLELIDALLWLGCILGIIVFCVAAVLLEILIILLEIADLCGNNS